MISGTFWNLFLFGTPFRLWNLYSALDAKCGELDGWVRNQWYIVLGQEFPYAEHLVSQFIASMHHP
jgi:hypothetical protein